MLARKLTVAVVLVALGLSACGSSSKSAGSTSGTTATTAGSQSSGDTSTTAEPSNNGGGGGGGGGGSFCTLMRKDDNAFKGADIATKSAGDLKGLYANVVPELERAQSDAPDAIKSDFATLVTGMKALVKALETADYDVTKLNPDSFKGLADTKFVAASEHITTYIAQHCGIKAN
jgi:hypothetical protein